MKQKEIKELADVIAKHATDIAPDTALNIAREMLPIAKRLHSWAEHDCNGTMNDARLAAEKRDAEAFRALCARIGCAARLTGDPRGYIARIIFPPGPDGRRPYNTWGGETEGWGVA